MVILIASISIAAAYLLLQLYYVHHWLKTPAIHLPESYKANTGISVIVVARNEESNIERCITGILHQNYPAHLFELIIIDDRSMDHTVEIAMNINHASLKCFRLVDFPEFVHSPAFKKSGIELGVHQSQNDLIVVTDADCIHHRDWLRTIAYAQEKKRSYFITGPVIIKGQANVLAKIQQTESLALMLITAAGIRNRMHDIANGANMAFSKTRFKEIRPYTDNYHYSSGDDMFLIEKMRSCFPDKITFLKSKSAVVTTIAKENWSSLLRQRLRWAAKNKGLRNQAINGIWVFVGIYHLTVLFVLILSLFNSSAWIPLLILLGIKWIADFIVIRMSSGFFNMPVHPGEFILLQILYKYYVLRLGWNLMLGRKGDW